MTHTEYKLQVAICKFLEMQYPDVMFLSDAISNVKLNKQQAARNKAIQKRDFACPDLMIFKPNEKYCGLFLELKQTSPYKLDGQLKKQTVKLKNTAGQITQVYDHLEEQERALRKLKNAGYAAEFCWSLDMAVSIINNYMKNKY
jgi:hypothetical protein